MIHDINIANYADDNTPFVSGYTPLHVITSLENSVEKNFCMVQQKSTESKP